MWLGILAVIGKVLDFINPWSKYWVDKNTDADKRKQSAQVDIEKAVNEDGQKGMDNYWDSRSRRKRS